LAVGNVGIIQLVPLLITSLWGGALADVLNRKKLLLSAEFGLALACALLLFNATLNQPHVWIIYVAAAISSALNGFHRPTLEAITPRLVAHEDLPAISALSSLKFSIVMIAGPAIAGFIIAKLGLVAVYFFDSMSYLLSIVAIYLIKTPLKITQTAEPILKSIKTGLQYALSRQELMGTYVVDIVAMIFGMPMALFPAIAETLGGVKILGWLYAAPALGTLLVSVFSGWTTKIQRQGKAVIIAASAWGLAIVAFGFTKNIYLAVLCLAIAGGADDVSAIFRQTIWSQTIPDQMRGRLAGIAMISYMSGPLLGNAEAGMVAAATNTTFSVVSGGVLCVAGVILCIFFLPRFWQYHAREWKLKQNSV
jgi:MFS family permease